MHRCVSLLQLLVLKVHLCQGVKVMQSQDGQNYLLYGVALNKRPLLWLFVSDAHFVIISLETLLCHVWLDHCSLGHYCGHLKPPQCDCVLTASFCVSTKREIMNSTIQNFLSLLADFRSWGNRYSSSKYLRDTNSSKVLNSSLFKSHEEMADHHEYCYF